MAAFTKALGLVLGWLKRSENVFSPPLIPRISTAIRSLGYGSLDKVLIKFEAFWNNKASETNGYHEPQNGSTRRPAFPIESLFLRPEYADNTNPAKCGKRSSHSQDCQSHSHNPLSCSSYMANGEGILLGLFEAWSRTLTNITGSLMTTSGRITPNFLTTILPPPNASHSNSCRQTGKVISLPALDVHQPAHWLWGWVEHFKSIKGEYG